MQIFESTLLKASFILFVEMSPKKLCQPEDYYFLGLKRSRKLVNYLRGSFSRLNVFDLFAKKHSRMLDVERYRCGVRLACSKLFVSYLPKTAGDMNSSSNFSGLIIFSKDAFFTLNLVLKFVFYLSMLMLDSLFGYVGIVVASPCDISYDLRNLSDT